MNKTPAIQDFEQQETIITAEIERLREEFADSGNQQIIHRIDNLEKQKELLIRSVFSNLTAWDEYQLARLVKRPLTLDYLSIMSDSYIEIHGDRINSDDHAIITALALIENQYVMVIGHQKGRNTKENSFRNFGSAHPGGYRKSLRAMRLAEKFNWPILCLIDTPAAACDDSAEKEGISQAISDNICQMFSIRTPIIAIVIGEGGSGGALGIAVADQVLMLEYSVYCILPPRSCASIIWRDPSKEKEAAEALKITSL